MLTISEAENFVTTILTESFSVDFRPEILFSVSINSIVLVELTSGYSYLVRKSPSGKVFAET